MVRLVIRLFIIVFLFAPASLWGATETFYMCDGGNGTDPENVACVGAGTCYDEGDFNTAGNWDTDDSDDGKIGPNDDVVFYDNGGDFDVKLVVQQSGLSGKPITLKVGTGETPTIDANAGDRALDFNGKDYITIIGAFTFTGATGDGHFGLYANSSTDNLIIDGVTSTGNQFGMGIQGDNHTIQNCTVHGNVAAGINCTNSTNAQFLKCTFYGNNTGGGNNDALFVGNNSTGFLVEDCVAYNHSTNSAGAAFDSSAAGAGSPAQGTYRRCVAHDNAGSGFQCSGDVKAVDQVVFHDCISYDNNCNFMFYQLVTATMINCVAGDATLTAIQMWHGSGDKDVTITNCIISGTYPYAVRINENYTNLTSTYNDWEDGTIAFGRDDGLGQNITWASWVATYGYDATGSLHQDPLFESIVDGSEDFELQAGSPCINTGTNGPGETYDDGILPGSTWTASVSTVDRDSYTPWDMGAYEKVLYISNASPANNDTNVSITVDLTWTNPTGTTSIDLLFDKDTNPPTTKELDDQDVETWDCGTLDYEGDYYWRVDINYAGGTETGTVYHFTTTAQQNPPTPTAVMKYAPGGATGIYEDSGVAIK